MTGFSLAWRPGGFTSCHCSLLLKNILCLIKWFAVGYTGFSLSLLLCALSVWLNGVFLYLRPCIPLCGRWVQAWHSAGAWQGELRSSMGLRPCQSNLQQYCDTVRAWGETCWHSALKRVGQLMSVEEDTLVMVFLSWNVFCLIALYKVFPSFDMQYLFKTISTHVRDFLQLVNSWWLEKFLFFFF